MDTAQPLPPLQNIPPGLEIPAFCEALPTMDPITLCNHFNISLQDLQTYLNHPRLHEYLALKDQYHALQTRLLAQQLTPAAIQTLARAQESPSLDTARRAATTLLKLAEPAPNVVPTPPVGIPPAPDTTPQSPDSPPNTDPLAPPAASATIQLPITNYQLPETTPGVPCPTG